MAKVLTGISGNLISAASAGFAPTNSADVSAIASAYQVVSATATQLYAGTAYVTSVNGAPVSASRAGNAANASLANSAWYDGTGRLISSLPDSAAVSAIASAYAESAASGKQDELTFSYDAEDKISAINGSAIAGGAGGVDSATVSAIASSYAESAVSSYQPLSGMSGYASAFSAGEGLEFVQSGSDQVLQVEAPVDIVAGPGIVIDNPDGNTLRVSTDENYEVELYKHTTVPYTNVNDVYTMSEPITNFERIRIEFWNREFQYMRVSFEYYVTDAVADSTQFIGFLDASSGTGGIQRVNMGVGFNSSGNLVDLLHGLFYGTGSSYTNGSNRGLGIHRVVGIHRIANN